MLEDNNNILLKRREIKSLIRNATGSIPRDEAANLIAGKIGVNKKNLLPISLKSEFGNPDVLALMYYYEDIEDIFKELKKTTGVDFSFYKPASINRRMIRRMLILNQSTFKEYAQ